MLVNECKYALLRHLTTVNDVAILLNIRKKRFRYYLVCEI